MTKKEFLYQINRWRCPKYILSQIKGGQPKKDCSAIICTASDRILLAKYENGKWQQACFTHATSGYPSQNIYYTDIKDNVIYWTDGEAKDYSRTKVMQINED